MLILVDKRIPAEAKIELSDYGEIIDFESNDIVYDAISGHPDIFFCQTPENLFIAPNTPDVYKDILSKRKIKFTLGENYLGEKYPDTSFYNAVITDKFLIHNIKYTDKKIINATTDRIKINVNQSYTRCNLLDLGDNKFITSDLGIYKALKLIPTVSILYVNPDQINLHGFQNGFFGGCCGFYNNNLFIIGNLNCYEDGAKIKEFINLFHINLVELSDNQLFDGGSILFIENN